MVRVSVGVERTIEGDIELRCDSDLIDPMLLNAHLTNPDRLWPFGLVVNRYHCLLEGAPGSKISKQQQATSSTVDFSELGRTET